MILSLAQWVKDLALRLRFGSVPWPGNPICHRTAKKEFYKKCPSLGHSTLDLVPVLQMLPVSWELAVTLVHRRGFKGPSHLLCSHLLFVAWGLFCCWGPPRVPALSRWELQQHHPPPPPPTPLTPPIP